ncbi:hypothetical protein K438DRAFT_1984983 [Mycena galopus ATCC 62051]|nr:hypothetical protein K438DRAFT_1984983 [Mycena galopus ATCC 62051]
MSRARNLHSRNKAKGTGIAKTKAPITNKAASHKKKRKPKKVQDSPSNKVEDSPSGFERTLKARIHLEGSTKTWEYLIKWEGSDPSNNQPWPSTWHDSSVFTDIAATDRFFADADCGGRDTHDLRQWADGDEVACLKVLDPAQSAIDHILSLPGTNSNATRVYALWAANMRFYPGIVRAMITAGLYEVLFQDGDSAEIRVEDMRRNELQIGDRVQTADNTATITKFDEEGVEVVQTAVRASLPISQKDIEDQWNEGQIIESALICLYNA